MKNSDFPAFPPTHDPNTHAFGLTKREYFAGLAMQAMISNHKIMEALAEVEGNLDRIMSSIATQAVCYSDFLLAKIDRKPTLPEALPDDGVA